MKTKKNNIERPASAANYWVNLAAIGLFFLVMVLARRIFPQMTTINLAVVCLAVTLLPILFYDFSVLKVHQRPTAGLAETPGPINGKRIVIKLIGLYATFLLILMLYHMNPVFTQSEKAAKFYGSFFVLLNYLTPVSVALSAIYFCEIDRRQKNPHDAYWQVGCLLTGRRNEVNGIVILEYAKGWFIKAFFLPFLFAVLVSYMDLLLSFNWKTDGRSFMLLYNHVMNTSYTMDVVFGVLGYILTVRFLDTHIQSTDPSILGWLACLSCYNPWIGIAQLPYDDDFQWQHWLSFFPTAFYVCGSIIMFLTVVIGLATVAFGYRMSNLTYRGIITTGPYRFTKHPAYLCKVTSWWLISLPFLSTDGTWASMLHTFNLSLISGIYYLRAKTEENHLSNYPEYVAYANWINEHGLLSFLGKLVPALRYSEEECRQWKSVVWFKKLNR